MLVRPVQVEGGKGGMTTKEQIVNDLYQGQLVHVDREEYVEWARTAIQEQAGKWVDQGDGIRAHIALSEVKRLDKVHQFSPFQPEGESPDHLRLLRSTPIENLETCPNCRWIGKRHELFSGHVTEIYHPKNKHGIVHETKYERCPRCGRWMYADGVSLRGR